MVREKTHFCFCLIYVNTAQNIYADRESRSTSIDLEYELSHSDFQVISSEFGNPSVDLFATQLIIKCPKYISWKPDPN